MCVFFFHFVFLKWWYPTDCCWHCKRLWDRIYWTTACSWSLVKQYLGSFCWLLNRKWVNCAQTNHLFCVFEVKPVCWIELPSVWSLCIFMVNIYTLGRQHLLQGKRLRLKYWIKKKYCLFIMCKHMLRDLTIKTTCTLFKTWILKS